MPGSSFGEYVWGWPHNEPFQSLGRNPWAVRNAVPLAPAGNIRMLDAVERRLAQGEGSAGLAPFLRRAGVRYLLVRNDLTKASGIPDPVLVHQALSASPGLDQVAGFGGEVGGEAHLEDDDGRRILINSGWQDQYRALEIYEVEGVWSAAEEATPDLPVVVGGPEDLLELADRDVLPPGPVRLAVDVGEAPADPGAPLVLTDGLRRAERHFGRVHDGVSATLTPDDPLRMDKPVRDYGIGDERWSTGAAYDGGAVSASSSMADANAYGTVTPGQQPFAAADADPRTFWRANYDTSRSAWWRLDLPSSRSLTEVTVTAGPDERERLRVRVDGGVSDAVVVEAGRSRTVEVDDSTTSSVLVEDASGRAGHQLALGDVRVSGVDVTRSLVLPEVPPDWPAPDIVALAAVSDARTGCVEVDEAVRCVPDRDVAPEEPAGFRRVVTLGASASYDDLRITARARAGDDLLSLLLRNQPIGVSASTTGNPDPRASALAAIDGDLGTTWTASTADLRPELRLSWVDERLVSGLRLSVADDTAAPAAGGTHDRVRQRTPDDRDGRLRWRRELPPGAHRWPDAAGARSGAGHQPGLRLRARCPCRWESRIFRVTGLPYTPVTLSNALLPRQCGDGPSVVVDGVPLRTSLAASPAQLYEGGEVTAVACGDAPVVLGDGVTDIEVTATGAVSPVSLVMSRADVGLGSSAPVDADGGSSPVARSFDPAEGGVLALRNNVNGGWGAKQGGRPLSAITVDGWRQAWRLDDAGPVTTRYAPDRTYRGGLVVGAVALLLLLGMGCWRRRATDDSPPIGGARARVPLVVLLAVGGGGLLAGWWGAAAAAATVAVGAVVVHRIPARAPQVAVALASAAFVPAVWRSCCGRGLIPTDGRAPWRGRPTWWWSRW